MKKIVLIALSVFLTVVASAQNLDNGYTCPPTHRPTIEAVQLDAYQADVLPIEMNVQYEMTLVDFYSRSMAVVFCDVQTLVITYTNPWGTVSLAIEHSLFNAARNHRHRSSDIMIRQVQTA